MLEWKVILATVLLLDSIIVDIHRLFTKHMHAGRELTGASHELRQVFDALLRPLQDNLCGRLGLASRREVLLTLFSVLSHFWLLHHLRVTWIA